jgi:FkbM family methyltransferase
MPRYYCLINQAIKMIQINGLQFKYRDGTEWDKYIINDELQGDMYEIPKNPKVVIDIGAHIGGTSILCASKGAEVFAYEPKKSNFDLLVENVALNGFQNKIHCFNKGVGNAGKRKLWLFQNNSGMPSLMDDRFVQTRTEYEMVDVISFNDVMKNIPHCDFMKVDCEGAEWEFLLNLSEENANKIDRIAAELHFEGNEQIGRYLEKFYKVNARPNLEAHCNNRFINCIK